MNCSVPDLQSAPLNQSCAPTPDKYPIFPAVDLVKFLMAFVIIGIHSQIFVQFKWLDIGFNVFSRIAVPFFFTASAFFFFQKPTTRAQCTKFTKRILILFILYSILFIGVATLVSGTFAPDMLWITLFSGVRHLWFLHALLFGMLFMALLDHCIKRRWIIYAIAALCLIFRCTLSTIYVLYDNIPPLVAIHDFFALLPCIGIWNALFYAFPFIAVGHAIKKTDYRYTLRTNLIGMAISFAILCIETFVCTRIIHSESHVLFLACIPLIYFIFSACLQIPYHRQTQNSAPTLFLRKSSTVIYCIQSMFIIYFVQYFSYGLSLFAVVSVCSAMFAMMVIWGSKTQYGHWLKYLQ